MKKILLIAAIALTLPFLPGCATGTASVIKALGQDTNSVTVDVVGWGVSAHVTRNMPAQTK